MAHEIKYWLALGRVKGVGKLAYKALIDEFKEPALVFDTQIKRLEEIPGIGKKTALNIKNFKEWDWVEKEIGLIKKQGVKFLTLTDTDYPNPLLSIPDPPPYLYVKGTICKEDERAIAIVGTRLPTLYGLSTAEKLARELSVYGITIISGMARGIDSAAHRGALAAKGRTIAVLGCGVDRVYPPENKKLYEQIISNGAVISEFPIGAPPLPENFPQRNRIISGLVKGVLVAEASLRSGSLITARLALDYGRDVFALPGSVTSSKSKGTNKLIKDGAKLVEDASDILVETSMNMSVGQGFNPAATIEGCPTAGTTNEIRPRLSSDEEKIMNLLEEPCLIDTIIQQTGLSAQKASALLLDMELKGLVQQQAGKQFLRR
ncbi:MAG: DNA protecting protein DprA [Deltaproteobacteria bacterium RIFCSPLOWO2_12_FULL_43_16]|nr:MAG: DNA protecting protein DprA [Deltaproteobacteria bacterium GWA2_43_19]OGQ11530.1 MAG: DNA protecting protein DprA [Deltaproteobacteria bacterium RIFCSPHIGHO2_02_FULL_43_33]OGQ60844.1 MAG: DNA protecting protein DprA [Deltaproteobacteria bacterium RIFCSPLOWO2_12_FULL_43_16]